MMPQMQSNEEPHPSKEDPWARSLYSPGPLAPAALQHPLKMLLASRGTNIVLRLVDVAGWPKFLSEMLLHPGTTSPTQAAGKTPFGDGFVSGHDFSRAVSRLKYAGL